MSATACHDRPPLGSRAALVGAAVLALYVLQLSTTILHVADEHHTLATDDHHDHEAPTDDDHGPSGPFHENHSLSDHLDETACRRTQIDDVPVLACDRAPQVDIAAPFSPLHELPSVTPTGPDPSPGPPSRAPPAA